MSTIYRCIGCDLHYCVDCDGGQDSCEKCHTGPWCDDCAAEHTHEDVQSEEE